MSTAVDYARPETRKKPVWDMNEDIVLSGIAGRFPESDNMDEYAKNLFDNVDMVTEDDRRWPIGKCKMSGTRWVVLFFPFVN